MNWLHTWSSVLVGCLLFAVFLTGTLAYFQHEITQWMQPE
ncbi:MAG: PepSY domain-containing protein, partial [Pseudoalteromonas sp.]